MALATTGAQAKDINARIGKLSFTRDFANGTLASSRNSTPLSGPT